MAPLLREPNFRTPSCRMEQSGTFEQGLTEFQIRRQSLQATFASETTFLITAKGTRRIKLVIRIGPDHAGTQFIHYLENLAAFVSPNARAQSIRRIVRAFDRFFRR